MLEAKDTVMSPEERIKFDKRFTTGSVNLKGLAEAQAEISFKAGHIFALSKEGHEAISYLEGHQAGEKQGYEKGRYDALEDNTVAIKQAGRKEVVEWINERIDWKFALDAQLGGHISLNTQQWQAKLKEWGL